VKKTPHTITGLGEVLWDIYPEARFMGGAPANAAVHASQLGARAAVVSAVGCDRDGDQLVQALAGRDIDTSGIQRACGYDTGSVHIRLNDAGTPSFVCSNDTAFDHMQQDSLNAAALNTDAVITGTLAQRNAESEEFIQSFLDNSRLSLIVYDANFRDIDPKTVSIVNRTAQKAGILKINEHEAAAMQTMYNKEHLSLPELARFLTDHFSLLYTAVTMGAQGAFITDGTRTVSGRALDIAVVDTTGCGDAFTAAMAITVLENKTLEEIIDFSLIVSAYTATRKGAVPLYTLDDIAAFADSSPR